MMYEELDLLEEQAYESEMRIVDALFYELGERAAIPLVYDVEEETDV